LAYSFSERVLETYWWMHRQPPLPPGIAEGNGRIEADPIDIDTKFAGRILELRADEGDMVKAGQVVAVMDTRDLAASLKKSEAQVEQAQKAINEARANLDQQHTQVLLAGQEMERTHATDGGRLGPSGGARAALTLARQARPPPRRRQLPEPRQLLHAAVRLLRTTPPLPALFSVINL
jgi:multidrug efflux pump subunit AcrA (membrane-fusion protein)